MSRSAAVTCRDGVAQSLADPHAKATGRAPKPGGAAAPVTANLQPSRRKHRGLDEQRGEELLDRIELVAKPTRC